MMSLFTSTFAADLQLGAPPPSADSIFVTDSYTVAAGDILKMGGGFGFKLMVKADTSPSLQIDGDVYLRGHHDVMWGVVSSHSVNGDCSVNIGETGSLTVNSQGAGGGLVALAGHNVDFTNAGAMRLSVSHGQAVGAILQANNLTVSNTGSLELSGQSFAYGYLLWSTGGGSFENDGSIASTGGMALGVGVAGMSFVNKGAITVVGTDPGNYAVGAATTIKFVEPSSSYAPAIAPIGFDNMGLILTSGPGEVVGVSLMDLQSFTNSGKIIAQSTADGATVIGVAFSTDVAGGLMRNDGVIKGEASLMAGDVAGPLGGTVDTTVSNDVVINDGKLLGHVFMGGGSDGIANTGRIVGNVDMGAGGDIYIGNRGHLEGMVLGGLGNDNITTGHADDVIYGDNLDGSPGAGGDDILRGMKGADSLYGGDGTDTLIGGQGADALTGGAGDDVFRFTKLTDAVAASPDLITDLTNTDSIDLSPIDADTGAGGDQAFHLVGSFSHAAGELTVSYDAGSDLTTIAGDVDGDGTADLVITASGDHHDFTNFVL